MLGFHPIGGGALGEGAAALQDVQPPEPEPHPSLGLGQGRPRRQPVLPPLIAQIVSEQAWQFSAGAVDLNAVAEVASIAPAQWSDGAGDLELSAEGGSRQQQVSNGYAWPSMRAVVRSEQAHCHGVATGELAMDSRIDSGIEPPKDPPQYSGKPLPKVFLLS